MVFNAYAAYYDLLYKDKDYNAEAEYIIALIKKHSTNASSIIDFGCGTGKHAAAFHLNNFSVTGVDLSEKMIAIANENFKADNLSFVSGDIRAIRLHQQYDVAVSLFHVMSYQTSNDDLLQSFQTASAHVINDGLFIFDCWYGPGVVADPPGQSHKTMHNDSVIVNRTATSTHNLARHTVNVHYNVAILQQATGTEHTLEEDHLMRYIFREEVEQLASQTSFKLRAMHKWLSTENLSDEKCWNAVFILQKQG